MRGPVLCTFAHAPSPPLCSASGSTLQQLVQCTAATRYACVFQVSLNSDGNGQRRRRRTVTVSRYIRTPTAHWHWPLLVCYAHTIGREGRHQWGFFSSHFYFISLARQSTQNHKCGFLREHLDALLEHLDALLEHLQGHVGCTELTRGYILERYSTTVQHLSQSYLIIIPLGG